MSCAATCSNGKWKPRRPAIIDVAGSLTRSGRYVPSLHDFQQKTVLDQTLTMDARQVRGAYGDDAAILKFFQNLKGSSQFFGWGRHDFCTVFRLLCGAILKFYRYTFIRLLRCIVFRL